jgi:LPS-assembly protein
VANVGATSHVIEPMGQVVAHNSHVDQDFLPNEDAQSLIFDDTNLFDTTKFSGYDRLETGVRANVGVQYTFQGPVGYARVLAGQSYHLAGTNAYDEIDNGFNPNSGLETDDSDYVLGVYLAPTDTFRIISQSRFGGRPYDPARGSHGRVQLWAAARGRHLHLWRRVRRGCFRRRRCGGI